jgi:endonuclease YncB( thermonuclease family)
MGNCCCIDNEKDLRNCTIENTPEFTLKGLNIKAKVVEVYDGDTITLAFKFDKSYYRKRCRLHGVDCAELMSRDMEEKKVAISTKLYVQNLVLDKLVEVRFDNKDDKYGRLLGSIFIGKDSIADLLVAKGLAYKYDGGAKKSFREWYKA